MGYVCYDGQIMPKHLIPAAPRPSARARGDNAPTPRAALAMAKSQAYQEAADAPATRSTPSTQLSARPCAVSDASMAPPPGAQPP